MGKWTRRGFISAGVLTGGALIVGVAIRPGHRAPKLAGMVAEGDEVLVNTWAVSYTHLTLPTIYSV